MYKFDSILNIQMFLNELLVSEAQQILIHKYFKYNIYTVCNFIEFQPIFSIKFVNLQDHNSFIFSNNSHTLKKTGSKFVIFKNYRTIESCDRFPKSQGPF